jgi:hypothetical protein
MKQVTKFTIGLAVAILLSSSLTQAQNGFDEYRKKQRESLTQFRQTKQKELTQFHDSMNMAFAKYLEETWKSFNLTKQERSFKPMPKLPVYVPDTPKPEPEKIPVVRESQPPAPKPSEEKPQPKPIEPQLDKDVSPPTVQAIFFGTPITLNRFTQSVQPLAGVSEKEVAAYWMALSKLKQEEWTTEILRIKADFKLNDWGMYLLINKLFETYFPNGTENEQVIFNVFTLNQLGYRAKIGKTHNELVPLLAFQNAVYNMPFFVYGNENNVKYSVLSLNRKNLSSIQTCSMEYAGVNKNLEISLTTNPDLAIYPLTKSLNDKQNNYNLQCNNNRVDFCATYPCVDFAVYAEAPLDELLMKSVESQMAPHIKNKSQEEAVNFLLHFVQYAFDYKTDQEQFGYEKWNFAEETITSAYSDCEDRAILFAQLVRRLLKMPVILVNYPNIHLATAVKFNNPNTTGDYIMVDGQKYLLCDPTYMGATLGMGMPELRSVAVEIIKFK